MERTTIQLNKDTKNILEKQKLHSRETFDQVLRRLLQEQEYDDELLPQTIKNIEKGIRDIKAGRVYTTEQLNRELKLS